MIYERKTNNTPCVKREDLAIGDTAVMCEKIDGGRGISVPEECYAGKTQKRKRTSGRVNRRPAGRIMRLCVFALICMIIGASGVFPKIADFGSKTTSLQGGESTFGRTLYTMKYAELAEKAPEIFPKAEDKKAEIEASQETEAVDNTFSENYVDGIKLYPIKALDLSAQDIFKLNNETSFSPDVHELAQGIPPALENTDVRQGPLVLIVHTHGTECYTKSTDMYPEGEELRSDNTDENVVRVGSEIAKTLGDFGIDTIHCTVMHDKASFINAYTSSAKTVKNYLEEYPSIRFVIDVHRDAIIRDDGESIKAVANIAGEDYAQLMFVVGTNELGHNHPDWQENLSLAVRLQREISQTYPSLCRSINLRDVPFNQQLSNGYLLLETGTSANTLDEALRSARAFGENLARVIMKP